MGRIATWSDGGTLLPSQLDSVEDDYECAFGTYKTLHVATMVLAAPAAGTFLFVPGYSGAGLTVASLLGSVWLDPARYWTAAATSGVNPRSVYYNLGVAGQTNATAVGTVTFTSGLYAITAADTLAAAPITGSTVTLTSPAASALQAGAWSGDFIAPAAGLFVPAVKVSAATTAGSQIALTCTLQVRQV